MHDLVHDLARSVVGNHECLIVESAHDIDYISEATRRLNLLVNLDDEVILPKVLEALKKAKNLRTVLVYLQTIDFDIGNAFKENKRLRVLDLRGFIGTTESTSSSSIGGLNHLRYLGVYGVSFPKGMIGRLSFLQTLRHFNVGDKKKNKNAGGIEELEGLNLLTGDLFIDHLQNVTSGTEACRANLKKKKNLRGLQLIWDRSYSGGDHANNNDEAVLEGLRPHLNLRTLRINGFEGSKLPRWIEDSSFLPHLVKLTLDRGIYIEQVAGFGALPSLRSLTLDNMKKLECMGNEFYYSAAAGGVGESSSSTASTGGEASTTPIAFPSLKSLTLINMVSLKEWDVPPTPIAFPLLEVIVIYYCDRLTTITPTTTIFPSLNCMDLHCIHGSAAETLVTNNLKSLTSLILYDIPNLVSLPRQGFMENNNILLSLHIELCPQFEGFFPPNNDDDQKVKGGRQQLQQISQEVSSSSSSSSLQSLKLYGCPALRYYPNIRSLTCLRTLEIQECKESKSLQDELTCLSSSSSLENLEHVKILKNEGAGGRGEVVFEWRKSSSF